jgi:predicted membrane protein
MDGKNCPICRCKITKSSYRKIKKEKKEQINENTNDVRREMSEDIRNALFHSVRIRDGTPNETNPNIISFPFDTVIDMSRMGLSFTITRMRHVGESL